MKKKMTCITCGTSDIDTERMDYCQKHNAYHCSRHHHNAYLFVGCDCSICEDEIVEIVLNGEQNG